MARRKAGRPSVYGFDQIQPGEAWVGNGDSLALERMRKAALSHARIFGKLFSTTKANGEITITRVE